MNKSILLAAIVGALACRGNAPVLAGTPRLDHREAHQRKRIHNGVANGELTRPEDAPPGRGPGAPAPRRSPRQIRRRRHRRASAPICSTKRTSSRAASIARSTTPRIATSHRTATPEGTSAVRARPFHFHGAAAQPVDSGRSAVRVSCAPHDATRRSGRTPPRATAALWRRHSCSHAHAQALPTRASGAHAGAAGRMRHARRSPKIPTKPDGRKIELFVARVPAISLNKAPDPLFLIAGGPGTSAVDLYTSSAPPFDRVRRDRDIVLVDQRGTGRSHRLDCKYGNENLFDAIRRGRRRARRPSSAATSCRRSPTCAVHHQRRGAAISTRCARRSDTSASISTADPMARAWRSTTRAAIPQSTRTLILDGVVESRTGAGPRRSPSTPSTRWSAS